MATMQENIEAGSQEQEQAVIKNPVEVINTIDSVEREYIESIKNQKENIQNMKFNPNFKKQMKECQKQGLVSGFIHPKEYLDLTQLLAEELQKEDSESTEEKVINIYQTYFTEEITKLRELVLKFPSIHILPAREEFKDLFDKYLNWEPKELSKHEANSKWLVSFVKLMDSKTKNPGTGRLLNSLCEVLRRTDILYYYKDISSEPSESSANDDRALTEYLAYKDIFTHLKNSQQFQNLKEDPRMPEVLMHIAHKRNSGEELFEVINLLDRDQNDISLDSTKEVSIDLKFLEEGQPNQIDPIFDQNVEPIKRVSPDDTSNIDTTTESSVEENSKTSESNQNPEPQPFSPEFTPTAENSAFDAWKSEHREGERVINTFKKWTRNYLLSNVRNYEAPSDKPVDATEAMRSSLYGEPEAKEAVVSQPTTDPYTASLIALRYLQFNIFNNEPQLNILDPTYRRQNVISTFMNRYCMITFSKKFYKSLIEHIQRCHSRIVISEGIHTLNQLIEVHLLMQVFLTAVMVFVMFEVHPQVLLEREHSFGALQDCVAIFTEIFEEYHGDEIKDIVKIQQGQKVKISSDDLIVVQTMHQVAKKFIANFKEIFMHFGLKEITDETIDISNQEELRLLKVLLNTQRFSSFNLHRTQVLDKILDKINQSQEEVFTLKELTNTAHMIIAHYLCEPKLPLDRLMKLHAVVVDKLFQNPDSEEAQNLYLEVLMAIHFLTKDSTPELLYFIREVVDKLQSFIKALKNTEESHKRNTNFAVVYTRLFGHLVSHSHKDLKNAGANLGVWYELVQLLQLRIVPTGALLDKLSDTEETKSEVPYFAPCDTLETAPECIKITIAFFEQYIKKDAVSTTEAVKQSEDLIKVFYMHLHFLDYFSNFEVLSNAIEAFSKGNVNSRVFGAPEDDMLKQISFEGLQKEQPEAYTDNVHSLLTKSDHFVFCAELWKHIVTTYKDISDIKDKFDTFMSLQFVGIKENWYFKSLWSFNEFKDLTLADAIDTKTTATEPSSNAEESKSDPSEPPKDFSEPKVVELPANEECLNLSTPARERTWDKLVLTRFPQALNLIRCFLHSTESNQEIIEGLCKITESNTARTRIIQLINKTLCNNEATKEMRGIFTNFVKYNLLPQPKILDVSTIAAGLVSAPKDLSKETMQDLGGLLAAMILSKESTDKDEPKLNIVNINKLLEAANIPVTFSFWKLLFSDMRLREEVDSIGTSTVSTELREIEEYQITYGSKSKAEAIMEENPYGALTGGFDENDYY